MKVLKFVSVTLAAVVIAGVWRMLAAGIDGDQLAVATEPAAVVDRFFHALASGDTAAASALLDPAVLIYESGGVERSRSEYAGHHLAADAAFLKTAKQRVLSRTSATVGDLAWVATEASLTVQGADPTDIISTETMILRKQLDGWKIVHIHWSSQEASR